MIEAQEDVSMEEVCLICHSYIGFFLPSEAMECIRKGGVVYIRVFPQHCKRIFKEIEEIGNIMGFYSIEEINHGKFVIFAISKKA